MNKLFWVYIVLLAYLPAQAQLLDPEKMDSLINTSQVVDRDTLSDGTILFLEVVDGDTIPVLHYPDFYVVSRRFDSEEDRKAFERMQKRVIKVYPYARKAVELMEKIEAETALIAKKRGRKNYKKDLEKQLSERFKDDLINLTMSEGQILVDLIERQTGEDMYDIIKDLKNPITAFFYQQLGKRFGYNLKKGYNAQEQRDLEIIIKGIEANGEQLNKAYDIF